MWSWIFWRRAAERAVLTFAQTLVSLIGGGEVVPKLDLSLLDSSKIALVAAGMSVLTSIIKSNIGKDPENPGLE